MDHLRCGIPVDRREKRRLWAPGKGIPRVDESRRETVSVEELIRHIQAKTRKGSVSYTDAFRGYQSLKRVGQHYTINHSKIFVSGRQPQNYINGIVGFGS